MTTNEFDIGKKLYIYIVKGDNLEASYEFVSQIADVLNQDEIVISAPLYKSYTLQLNAGDTINVYFTSDNGLYIFKGEVVEEDIQNDLLFYKIYIISEIQRIQRRHYFRISINVPVVYSYQKENKEIYGQGITEDLSGGGVKFVCEEKLNKGEIINTFVAFDEHTELNTKGKIIRCNKIESNKYEISLNFTDISFNQQETLIKYIFKVHRKMLRKMKDN